MHSLSDLRREYSMATLDTSTVSPDPLAQFTRWFSEALDSKVMEPNAMNLSTVQPSGRPSARIVLLKGLEGGNFVFYTNYQSDKGRDLEQNPACALTFFWPELERQVRIEGVASRVPAAQSDAYFNSRPRGSQLGAWASPQSTPIADRRLLEERMTALASRFEGQDIIPRPNQWGGYAVDPLLIEFWQGRANRLHDRLEYTLVDGKWSVVRLAP